VLSIGSRPLPQSHASSCLRRRICFELVQGDGGWDFMPGALGCAHLLHHNVQHRPRFLTCMWQCLAARLQGIAILDHLKDPAAIKLVNVS
jgi:hypothetical protein